MVRAACYSGGVALRMALIVCVLLLRFFAQPAPIAPDAAAPPPPAEDRIAVADDGAHDGGDDPSDLDDSDDDPDDVALPAAIATFVPCVAAPPAAWRLLPLTDKDSRDPLFRPPRAA